jgi:CcmD family protein
MHNAMMRCLWVSMALLAALAGPASVGPFRSVPLLAQQPQQQDEFIPIDQLPPQDQLPAAPLLITAYSFVVLALFAYVLSVSRRLGTVQQELNRLQSETKRCRL